MGDRYLWSGAVVVLFLLMLMQNACASQTIVDDGQSVPVVDTRPVEATAALSTPTPPPHDKANADVRFVEARQEAGGTWTFTVTVAHPDQGWDDYADGWDVVLPDGSVAKPDPDSLFTRLLLHPHETEQPFTRSQSSIMIPEEVTLVTVRAHDLVDGFGGQEIEVDLTVDSGPGFEVRR